MCSRDQILVTAAFLWQKLSQPQFSKDLTRKTAFFEGWSWLRLNNLGLALDKNLKFYNSVVKGLKLKVRKFGNNSYVCRSYWGKTGRGGGFLPPLPLPPPRSSWIGLKFKKYSVNTKIWNRIIKNRTIEIKRIWNEEIVIAITVKKITITTLIMMRMTKIIINVSNLLKML